MLVITLCAKSICTHAKCVGNSGLGDTADLAAPSPCAGRAPRRGARRVILQGRGAKLCRAMASCAGLCIAELCCGSQAVPCYAMPCHAMHTCPPQLQAESQLPGTIRRRALR